MIKVFLTADEAEVQKYRDRDDVRHRWTIDGSWIIITTETILPSGGVGTVSRVIYPAHMVDHVEVE